MASPSLCVAEDARWWPILRAPFPHLPPLGLQAPSDNFYSMCRWKAGQAALFSAMEWANRLCRLADARQTAQQVRLFSREKKCAKTVTRNHWRTSPAVMSSGLWPSNKLKAGESSALASHRGASPRGCQDRLLRLSWLCQNALEDT